MSEFTNDDIRWIILTTIELNKKFLTITTKNVNGKNILVKTKNNKPLGLI
jgi:hypothetical protein